MNKSTVTELAYFLKEAKSQGMPGPIFFLGAGASKSSGILLANEIVEDILVRYCDNPKIKSLPKDDITYSTVMECIGPNARNSVLKEYIDAAKINVTHIYIAQLMMHGFADYVLTVNFDNLMQRALALYNEFPPTYDMAILKDLTTTTFREKSIVYLHGQHHGLWLLNTSEEMAKVNEIVPPILNGIRNQRPWIFIGYSGEDPIFDHIKKLGRFDNGLYWVGYNDHKPSLKVSKELLSKPNTNAFLIDGYDADSFMLKLNKELELPEPEIIDKPFSSLRSMINNIVDIDDKKHFKGVKERLDISKNQVDKAIQQFEYGNLESKEMKNETAEIELFKKEIIDISINEDYNENKISKIEIKVNKLDNKDVNSLMAGLYVNWGTKLWLLAKNISDTKSEKLNRKAIEIFEKASILNPNDSDVFYGWGVALGNIGNNKSGIEAQTLYKQALNKFKKAVDINPNNQKVYRDLGGVLGSIARMSTGNEKVNLINQARKELEKARDLGSGSYNLACIYAISNDKKNALKYLEQSLLDNEIEVKFIKKDKDWAFFYDDKDFKNLLNLYS
ncbi:MAG: hypothetical protein GQ564_21950 [Bacteroidales bacterium]|nr:hypothetical protein [Bacteroidales bacterium]